MPKSLVSLRKTAFLRQGGTCFYCGLPVWETEPELFRRRFGLSKGQVTPLRATAEHLIARQDGGRDTPENVVAACIHCNRTRHRCKRPMSPLALRERVQTRMASRRWHPACSFKGFPLLARAGSASEGSQANLTARKPGLAHLTTAGQFRDTADWKRRKFRASG